MARIFGAPETVPAGKAASSASSADLPGASSRFDARHQVEDVRVALDFEEALDRDGSRRRHPAEVVAPEVDQHDVLGALFRVGEQLRREGAIGVGIDSPRRRVPAIGRVTSRSPVFFTSISGEAPMSATSGNSSSTM